MNTVLASIAAKAFKEFADAIEKGATPKSVAQKALKDSWKVSESGSLESCTQTPTGTTHSHCTVNHELTLTPIYPTPPHTHLR